MKTPMLRFSLVVTAIIIAAALRPVGLTHAAEEPLPAHLADMKVEDLRAGGDEKKRYFVIHRPVEAPTEGWRTLFVMPGGPGSADFRTFVTAITKFALPENYLVVQLVAPVWDEKQPQMNVWPLEKNRYPRMKFSTEDFFLAVKSDVEKKHKLDPRYVFTLTWSSSGSAGYTLSVHPKASVTGTFVAMSVFQPAILPTLNRAKGHPYFLYHSPTDFIPLKHAETARDTLKKEGAQVELATYPGGHGWTGDTMNDIRKAITWLESKVATKAVTAGPGVR
jgi:predicted esterase